MGNFLNKFRGIKNNLENQHGSIQIKDNNSPKNYNNKIKEKSQDKLGANYDGIDDFSDMNFNNQMGGMGGFGMGGFGMGGSGIGIQPAQKPESFHHFLLENQYKDLEKSIRGYKDVFNKDIREWEVKRKDKHCFTDEEAEDILRLTQSLLSTDIKLGFINKDDFGATMMMIYKRLEQLFREIAEYKYGRYSHDADGNEIVGGFGFEQFMKLQNLKIFLELTERIKANYSRSIQGVENKMTHQSVQGQESLQTRGMDPFMNQMRRYS
jgi:hypothetical protein